jgi:hypothetical protein
VKVIGSPVTLFSFTPSGNGGIRWAYDADNLGLTGRSGTIHARWDTTDNIAKYFDEATLDTVDYLTAPGAPTAALAGTTGLNTAGAHAVKITFVTAIGETEAGTASGSVTVTGAGEDISLTGIPVSADAACTARKIYMTEAGGAAYKLVDTIANNTATTYTIDCADGSLGADAPSANTTAQADSTALSFDVSMAAGVVYLKATSTTGTWTVKTEEIARLI